MSNVNVVPLSSDASTTTGEVCVPVRRTTKLMLSGICAVKLNSGEVSAWLILALVDTTAFGLEKGVDELVVKSLVPGVMLCVESQPVGRAGCATVSNRSMKGKLPVWALPFGGYHAHSATMSSMSGQERTELAMGGLTYDGRKTSCEMQEETNAVVTTVAFQTRSQYR